MIEVKKPKAWQIILLGGLALFPETVYSPSLPSIAKTLKTTPSMVEYTLTIYLFSFSVGSLFWGRISDYFGRKPCVLSGLFVFILGCVGCYFSNSIYTLLIARFIQAFGASIGSVLTQAMLRDSFEGPALGKTYSLLGSALAISPAIGPVIGGIIVERVFWSHIFSSLAVLGFIVLVIMTRLPETHIRANRQGISFWKVASLLLRDKRVMVLCFFIGGVNGIRFSYFAEAPFLMTSLLGVSPTTFGLTFVLISLSAMFSSLYTKTLYDHYSTKNIMNRGLNIILFGCVVMCSLVYFSLFVSLGNLMTAIFLLFSMIVITFGTNILVGSSLSLALQNYKWCTGTASSLFGFFYYCLTSLFTFGMGMIHNGSLLPMPFYFLMIGVVMKIMKYLLDKENY